MHICYITADYPPRLGGVGDYVWHLSREMRRRGFDVTVVTTEGLGGTSDSDERTAPRVLAVIRNWNLRGVPKLLRVLQRVAADAYVLEYVPYMYGRGGVALWLVLFFWTFKLKRLGPLVINAHELWRPPYRSAKDKLLTLASFAGFLSAVWASTTLVITNVFRETLATRVLGINPKRVKRIPVGANIIPSPRRRGRAHNDRDFHVVTFGCWHEDRAVEDVVEAVASLRRTRRIGLSVIGDFTGNGKQRARVRAVTEKAGREEWLEITGCLPAAQVSGYLTRADVFVSPLAGGPSGRRGSLLTALAHGLPIVAYDGGERDDIFQDGANVVLANAGERAGIVTALETIINDRRKQRSLAAKARATFEEHFAWPKIAARWEEEVFAPLTGSQGGDD